MTDYSSSHRRLFRLVIASRKPWMLMALLSLCSAGTVIMLMHGLSTGIDTVFMQQEPISSAASVLLITGTAVALRGFLFWIHEIVAKESASKIKASLRSQLFSKVQELGPVWAESQNSGELAAAAVEGVEKLNNYFARYIPAAIHMSIVPAVIVVAVFLVDWLSGLVLLITGPLIPVFMSLIGMRAQQQVQRQWSSLRYLSSHFLDVVQGLRTLKLYNQSSRKHAEIEANSDRFRVSTIGVLKIAFLSGFVLELFASIATALVAVEVGVRLVEGHIGFQVGLFVLLLAPEYYLPFRMFGAQHHAGMEAAEAAGRIFQILDSQGVIGKDTNMISEEGIPVAVPKLSLQFAKAYPGHPHGSVKGKELPESSYCECDAPLSFENVTFSYPGNKLPLLTDCTFYLAKGMKTALVGRTGSGKTTILRLMTRQLHPDTGSICLHGMCIDKLSEAQWLANMAVASQTSWFFDGTVLENLRAARPAATREEVIEASVAAGAHTFIKKLPDGYQTRVGEFAARFSGGERQRFSIARALLKDAPIMIMDEPTSALDPESEDAINRALHMRLTGKTMLIIAHRLSTVRKADRILVLDGGYITAEGSHRRLLENCTLYRQMVTAYSV
jgi:thiol reductant ABC exporter CydD subunit